MQNVLCNNKDVILKADFYICFSDDDVLQFPYLGPYYRKFVKIFQTQRFQVLFFLRLKV
jgi:hypothetical protein